jgi:hypothetical protein
MHVAVADDDAVVGFVAVTDPPARSQVGLSAIIRAVLDLAESLEFNGKPIAQQRYASATTKLGAKSLAAFEADSHTYHFLAFTF